MAIALESSNRVWQKVKTALVDANPSHQNAFAELKKYLATQKRNVDLQFIPFTAEGIVTDTGYSPDVDACTIYGVYIKGRRTTGTTSSFVAVHDATTNGASTTTLLTQRLKVAGESFSATYPSGQPVATEITVSAATAVGGATESSAADAADGFLIIGA